MTELKKNFSWQRFIQDPTTLFALSVLIVPLIMADDLSTRLWYVLTPALWLSILFLIIFLHFVHRDSSKTVPLSEREHRIALWFLINGVYFNFFLDVVAGQLGLFGELSVQYHKIEPKYKLGLYQTSGQSVFMASMCELFFQTPICLLIYYAYHRGKDYRPLLEILIAPLHICGVWWLYPPEILTNFPHGDGWPKSLAECFSFHRILYFWSAYFIFPAVWVVVPIIIAKSAWLQALGKIKQL